MRGKILAKEWGLERGSSLVFERKRKMVRLLIVRHGYSLTNKDKKYTGQTDVPLDRIGHLQAEAAARYIAEKYKVDAIYSSDLCRAVETARPLSERLSLPIYKDARLREYFMGEWEGMGFAEAKEKFSETAAILKSEPWRVRYDGGESMDEVFMRIRGFMEEILRENEGKTVAVVSHGGAIRQILRYVMHLPPERCSEIPQPANASISELEVEGEVTRAVRISVTEHLAALRANEIEVR